MNRSFSTRRRSTLGRRRRPSFWRQQWQKLSLAQQSRVKSMAWAASAHFLLIAILAAIGLASPTRLTMNLYGAFERSNAVATFELLPVADIEEMFEEELAVLEELPLTEEEVLKEILDIEPLSEPSPQLITETGEAMPSEALQQVQLPSAISDLQSDAQRIAETNRRVAAAGGMLDGPLRFSLIFSGDDDIDLHVQYQEIGRSINPRFRGFGMPVGGMLSHIFFGNPRTNHAALDVDANAQSIAAHPCENIIFRTVPRTANYTVAINHYRARGTVEPTPYVVVVNYGRRTRVFEGTIVPQDGTKVIWTFKYSD